MSRSPKQVAGAQRRSLRTIEKKLLDMAAEWGDVDAYNEAELEDLANRVSSVAETLNQK